VRSSIGGIWARASGRNLKENLREVDGSRILEQLVSLPSPSGTITRNRHAHATLAPRLSASIQPSVWALMRSRFPQWLRQVFHSPRS